MSAPASTVQHTAQSQDEAQIRQLIAARETAMRARDAERLVSYYAPGS